MIPGDHVQTDDGKAVGVAWIVRTRIESGRTTLVRVDKHVRITPYHPFRRDGQEWVFPISIASAREMRCDAVYSFVLAQPGASSIAVEGGAVVASLGHGDTTSETALAHPYFGDRERVLRDLERMEPMGLNFPFNRIVELIDADAPLRRDVQNGGKVVGMVQEKRRRRREVS